MALSIIQLSRESDDDERFWLKDNFRCAKVSTASYVLDPDIFLDSFNMQAKQSQFLVAIGTIYTYTIKLFNFLRALWIILDLSLSAFLMLDHCLPLPVLIMAILYNKYLVKHLLKHFA